MNDPVDELSVWAVRYALGRMTYAVANVCDVLVLNADRLSANSRRVIVADINEAMARGNVGMDMDRRQWERLHDVLGKRCNHWPGQKDCEWCRPQSEEAQRDE